MAKLKVLELYCGIGGMHYALKSSKFNNKTEVIAAIDISPLASAVYKHNFPSINHMEKCIEGLSVKKLDKLKFDVIMMSPPCQPFTRVGLKKDIEDPRSKPFLYLLDVLPKLQNPPSYILLENVKGFEISEAFERLHSVLTKMNYYIQSFLLTPKQFGIPNARLRYYMVARKTSPFDKQWSKTDLLKNLPSVVEEDQDKSFNEKSDLQTNLLSDYIEEEANKNADLILSQKIRSRYEEIMDIVNPKSTNSICFTKAYSQYVEGTGSVLTGFDDYQNLRYFSPREIANLLGFPKKDFKFPESTTNKQMYRLLGNSLNVIVVSKLVSILFEDHDS